MLSERSHLKTLLYDFKYMTVWQKQSYRDNEDEWWCQGFGDKRERERWIGNTWVVLGSKTTVYDTVMINPWHYEFVKIHEAVQHKE